MKNPQLQFYQNILQHVTDSIIVTDLGGNITYWNKGAHTIFGYTEKEMLGKNPSVLYPTVDFSSYTADLKNILKGVDYHGEWQGRRKDGRNIWVHIRTTRLIDSEGKMQGFIGIAKDITRRKSTEADLKRSEVQFKALYDANIIGVLYCDLDGNIFDANKAFLSMLGYTKKDIKREKIYWNSLTPKKYAEADARAVDELRLHGAVTPFEKEYIHKDGSTVPVIVGAALLDKDRSETIAFVLNITERKRLEERKDEFISIASHELKTPLTSIKGYTQILERIISKSGDNRTKTLLAKTNSYIDKLNNLIGDLLDISRIQSGKLLLNKESIDLDVLIKEVIDSVQPISSRHKLIFDSQLKVLIQGDKQRLEQVLTNLFTNAIKYSPAGGKVIVNQNIVGSEVVISVKDEGIGIPESDHQHLFSRFYRVEKTSKQFSGLGIGLYISNEIVIRHKGRMWVDSEEGKGSTFYVSLPVNS